MHLLYLDESGHASDPRQTHVVLAGFSIFERQGYWISKALDEIAGRFSRDAELHGNPMIQGKNRTWRQYPQDVREKAVRDALQVLVDTPPYIRSRVFAVVVKKSLLPSDDPIKYAFEQVASRFDRFLMRLHRAGDTQRGIIIFDKSKSYEEPIQLLARDFRSIGHTWGVIRNLSEVPVFLDSKASRLVQLADLVAYATFRKYEKADDRFFQIIEDKIDRDSGILHGLHTKL